MQRSALFVTPLAGTASGISIAISASDAEFMGGEFYALALSTFDNVTTDELAAAPLKFNDNLHDRFDRAPADTRLM